MSPKNYPECSPADMALQSGQDTIAEAFSTKLLADEVPASWGGFAVRQALEASIRDRIKAVLDTFGYHVLARDLDGEAVVVAIVNSTTLNVHFTALAGGLGTKLIRERGFKITDATIDAISISRTFECAGDVADFLCDFGVRHRPR